MPRVILAAVVAAALSYSCSPQNPRQDVRLFPVGADGKAGYVDSAGTLVIKLQFDDAMEFSEGFAAVSVGNKWGYIDKTGAFVVSPQFDKAGPLSEALAAVAVADKLGFVDRTGHFVVPPRFRAPSFLSFIRFTEGLAAVPMSEKWGYIDRGGRVVIDSQYDFARAFHEGISAPWRAEESGAL